MKNVVKSISIVIVLLTVSVNFANEPILKVLSNQEKVLDIQMNTDAHQTKLQIVDINSEVIYAERIDSKSSYAKKLSLESIPSGTYFLSFDDVTKKTVFTLEVSKGSITVLKKEEKIKPVYSYKNGKLVLNFINLEEKDVKVTIVDSEGRTLYEEVMVNEKYIGKVFNFTKAFEDTYTVIIKDENNTYFNNVIID